MTYEEERVLTAKWTHRRWVVCGLSMTILPFVVIGLCFALSKSNDSPILGIAIPSALGVGLVAAWQCPMVWWGKILSSLAYTLLMSPLLFALVVNRACGMHEACL